MSKTDNCEQYQPEIFKRKKLRPWDDPVNFIPSKVFEDTNHHNHNKIKHNHINNT